MAGRRVLSVLPEGPRARAHRMADQLREVLERQIAEGLVSPGEHLAPERELAQRYGASRSAVRAALSELHKAGKITRHVGRGTLVARPSDSALVTDLAPFDASPAELIEFRLALEPALAPAIVVHANSRDLQEIIDCVDRGNGAARWEEFEHWDRVFHRLLYTATHNRLIAQVYDMISAVRQNATWGRLKQQRTNSAKWEVYQSEHRRIAEALLARDAEQAARVIRAHLLHVRAKMLDN